MGNENEVPVKSSQGSKQGTRFISAESFNDKNSTGDLNGNLSSGT